mmetsp:Transcript_125338/g.187212  ORF Transcript_125338/g.187212 Transcript_125338/m.187212 type:complete len:293 (-) Transcript_125338:250-1128(-)
MVLASACARSFLSSDTVLSMAFSPVLSAAWSSFASVKLTPSCCSAACSCVARYCSRCSACASRRLPWKYCVLSISSFLPAAASLFFAAPASAPNIAVYESASAASASKSWALWRLSSASFASIWALLSSVSASCSSSSAARLSCCCCAWKRSLAAVCWAYMAPWFSSCTFCLLSSAFSRDVWERCWKSMYAFEVFLRISSEMRISRLAGLASSSVFATAFFTASTSLDSIGRLVCSCCTNDCRRMVSTSLARVRGAMYSRASRCASKRCVSCSSRSSSSTCVLRAFMKASSS